ncbi:MAG: zinc-binding alcohol dehydrogenase family protein [Candidatus Riflebacteria bacterium]|nr:zinc-binding alcohol dehydrogenase family protein [Candidatus Riflebacteria bacterium]
MFKTEAWVLHRGSDEGARSAPGRLELESVEIPDITDSEALIEPLIGCWEANITHALERRPIDVCLARKEPTVILGNTGVVRVLTVGSAVRELDEGDCCVVAGVDTGRRRFAMPDRAWAYDQPGSSGLFARRSKIAADKLIKLPRNSPVRLEQWAAMSGRYFAGWPNFKLAHATLRAVVSEAVHPSPFALAWGGGVSIAQLELARLHGYRCAMIASTDERLGLIASKGFIPIDRRRFLDLWFDEQAHETDRAARDRYLAAERTFLDIVGEVTAGGGASIFFDHIGTPVARATLKALASPGVMATVGWKHGMKTSQLRAIECMGWHTHVFTHLARPADARDAAAFAHERGWAPDPLPEPYPFERIPELAARYSDGLQTYFPLYRVNPL